MAIGWMAEWSKAAVLKTVEVQASGGSNPSPSVLVCIGVVGFSRLDALQPYPSPQCDRIFWSDGRAVEGASLLRKYTGNGIRGSNPRHSENKRHWIKSGGVLFCLYFTEELNSRDN